MGATRADTFDHDERFTLPDDDTDPYEVLKRLLGPGGASNGRTKKSDRRLPGWSVRIKTLISGPIASASGLPRPT
jgi:hypothetical protein